MLADMHTHSEYSHDSECKIADMMAAQAAKGIDIFAVTDHFDTHSYLDYDIFTPIKTAFDTVQSLNRLNQNKPLILSGIEISEGFWHPEVCKKGLSLVPYDVVIGSVHCVNIGDKCFAYSAKDFSQFSTDELLEFWDTYFKDMLTMLDTVDFDVLAHLTCPLRYIVGKYGLSFDIMRYEAKLDEILHRVLERGIALEVNTSCVKTLNKTMPSLAIVKKYYNMGGRLIALGSDAHTAQNAAQHFEEVIKSLKEIGFDSIYYYKDRKPHPIKL